MQPCCPVQFGLTTMMTMTKTCATCLQPRCLPHGSGVFLPYSNMHYWIVLQPCGQLSALLALLYALWLAFAAHALCSQLRFIPCGPRIQLVLHVFLAALAHSLRFSLTARSLRLQLLLCYYGSVVIFAVACAMHQKLRLHGIRINIALVVDVLLPPLMAAVWALSLSPSLTIIVAPTDVFVVAFFVVVDCPVTFAKNNEHNRATKVAFILQVGLYYHCCFLCCRKEMFKY